MQQEEKKHAAWGKAGCSWFWHLSAESPGKWFQWCQLDGMFNFACVAGLRIRIWAFANHTIFAGLQKFSWGSGGGGRSAQKMHNSWQLFGPSLVWTDLEQVVLTGWKWMCTKKNCWERKKKNGIQKLEKQSTSDCYVWLFGYFSVKRSVFHHRRQVKIPTIWIRLKPHCGVNFIAMLRLGHVAGGCLYTCRSIWWVILVLM